MSLVLHPSFLGFLAVWDNYIYRKSMYGNVTHQALLVDAIGTFMVPTQPTTLVSLVGQLLSPGSASSHFNDSLRQ
jgi:hypothetical protein